MVDRARLADVVLAAIREYNDQVPEDRRLTPSLQAVLFGKNGLDSLGVVSVVVGVEMAVAEAFGEEISIANEEAMSRRSSPFRTVGTLIDYVSELLQGC